MTMTTMMSDTGMAVHGTATTMMSGTGMAVHGTADANPFSKTCLTLTNAGRQGTLLG
jgi:hypothetical protein